MLRHIALLLLAANLAFFAWTQGWLDGLVGIRASGDREPERLALQVRADTVRILPSGGTEAAAASAPAPAVAAAPTPAAPASVAAAANACLEAGPFTPAEVAGASAAAQAVVAADRIAEQRTERPGRWIVYLGQYLSREDLERKVEELKKLKIEYVDIRGVPELEPGLQLGFYREKANAERALEQFSKSGVRGARIVQTQAPGSSSVLRIERLDASSASALLALKDDALRGGFRACPKAATTG